MNIDEYNASLEKQDDQQGQAPIEDQEIQDDMDRLFDYGDEEDEDEDEVETETDDEDLSDNEDEKEVENSEAEVEEGSSTDEEKTDESEKKVQSAEENARFAEMRRQQQEQKRLQEMVQQTPEYQIAQMLANRYGVTTEQMLEQLRENEIQQQAKKEGVPIEFLRRMQAQEQRIQEQERQFQMIQYQAWEKRISSEKEIVKTSFPMLDNSDVEKAVEYLFQIRNTDLPLEDAVFAVHGKKIAEGLREQARQDALAEISGRTKSPVVTQGGKPNPTAVLTAEEKYVAKQMGISEKDYLKYKN